MSENVVIECDDLTLTAIVPQEKEKLVVFSLLEDEITIVFKSSEQIMQLCERLWQAMQIVWKDS